MAPGLLLGGAVIVESGINSNGRYIKFGDGTMMCWHAINLGSILAFGTGTFADLYRTNPRDWTYPHAFASNPMVVATAQWFTTTSAGRAILVSLGDVNPTAARNIQAFRASGSTQDTDVVIRLIAIGRWK